MPSAATGSGVGLDVSAVVGRRLPSAVASVDGAVGRFGCTYRTLAAGGYTLSGTIIAV